MPKTAEGSSPKKSNTVLLVSILVAVPVVLTCCCGVGVGTWVAFYGSGVPGFTTARLDPNNVENTRAWAENTVARLSEIDAKGNRAATDAEVAKAKKELEGALLGKKVRWSFAVNGMRDGENEVDVQTFFGKEDGRFPQGPDPTLSGKPKYKLYFRVFFEQGGDGVVVGNDVTRLQAAALRKGNTHTLTRKVIDVDVRQHDDWVSPDRWNNRVDVLDKFCVDIILQRE